MLSLARGVLAWRARARPDPKEAPIDTRETSDDEPLPQSDALLFAVFNEIGMINQLATTRLESVLPDGLLMSHFTALNHLVKLGDGRSLSSMAFAFQVTKATMTNTAKRLVERGLVEVRPDPNDGRAKLVYLTDDGRATRDAAIESLLPSVRKLAGYVGVERFHALLPHLTVLRTTLDAHRDVRTNDPSQRALATRVVEHATDKD